MLGWQGSLTLLILLLLGGTASFFCYEAAKSLRQAGNVSIEPHIRSQASQKAKFNRIFAWLSGLLTIWLTMAALMGHEPIKGAADNIKARSLMTLPKEATVVKVEFGDWGGDGDVNFTLPKDRPASEWLDTIWKLNPPEKTIDGWSKDYFGRENISRQNERIARFASAEQSIRYAEETGVYSFHIMLER